MQKKRKSWLNDRLLSFSIAKMFPSIGNIEEVNAEPYQTSKMKLSMKVVKG